MSKTNTEIAINFLQQVVAGRVDAAYEAYVSPRMRHHNPDFAGDEASLRQGMKENHSEHPNKKLTVHRVVSEGQIVAVHSNIQMSSEDQGMAAVHLFKIEAGKIEEMWSVGQQVPENMANENGMF